MPSVILGNHRAARNRSLESRRWLGGVGRKVGPGHPFRAHCAIMRNGPRDRAGEGNKGGNARVDMPRDGAACLPSYHESALQGTGVIRSDDLGRLYFRMISPFSIGNARHKSLFGPKPVGELYAQEDHVMLRAVDENGDEWRSNPLRIDLSSQIPVPGYRVRTILFSISRSRERKKIDHSSARILIPGVPALPFDAITHNRRSAGGREIGFSHSFDHHQHTIGEATVIFRREEGGFLSVSSFQDGALLPTWAGLMCHTLGFA